MIKLISLVVYVKTCKICMKKRIQEDKVVSAFSSLGHISPEKKGLCLRWILFLCNKIYLNKS